MEKPVFRSRYETEFPGYPKGDTGFWCGLAARISYSAFAFPAHEWHDAVVLFKTEPHKTSDEQSYYCSYNKRSNGLTALIQLLKVHSKYGSGKIDWYVNKCQDCDWGLSACLNSDTDGLPTYLDYRLISELFHRIIDYDSYLVLLRPFACLRAGWTFLTLRSIGLQYEVACNLEPPLL